MRRPKLYAEARKNRKRLKEQKKSLSQKNKGQEADPQGEETSLGRDLLSQVAEKGGMVINIQDPSKDASRGLLQSHILSLDLTLL